MKIILKKENKLREVKTGNANYVYWMLFVPIIGVFISIFRRQFKMVAVNTWLLQAIVLLPITVVIFTLQQVFAGGILLFITNFLFFVLYFIILLVWLTAVVGITNYLTIKQYITEGYEIVNEASPELEAELAKVEAVQKPKWIMIY
jgi:predicted membrane protein